MTWSCYVILYWESWAWTCFLRAFYIISSMISCLNRVSQEVWNLQLLFTADWIIKRKWMNSSACILFQCCFSFMLVADIYSREFSSIVYHRICDTVVIQLILNQLYKSVVFHVIDVNWILHWFTSKKILWSAAYVTMKIVTDLYYENFDWSDWYWLRFLEISFIEDDIT